ncbi:MAG: hypothetical protein AAF645_16175 [Myxococcota bacterium]
MKTTSIYGLGLLLSLAACGDDDGMVAPDMSAPRPGDSGTENPWITEAVSDTTAGNGLSLTMEGSAPVVAYFAGDSEDGGPCEEVRQADVEPPDRNFWPLFLARRSGGSWSEGRVGQQLSLAAPIGLDLAMVGGAATVAAMSGDPYVQGLQRVCERHDLGFYTEGGDVRTLVEDSSEAAFDVASDAGFMVGEWPAVATNGGTTLVAYRDVHFGGIQSDDERRADLEAVIVDGGSTRAVPVDPGRGAGRFNEAIFDTSGRPYIVYVNEFEFDDTSRGTLVARSLDDGATWEIHRLSEDTDRGPSIWLDEQGQVNVAYYDEERRQLALQILEDVDAFDGEGWTLERIGDPQFDEGVDPSGATDADGYTAIAYHRCNTITGGSMCDGNRDGLVVASRAPGDRDWTIELVDEGNDGARCGTDASLAFTEAGDVWVAYSCQSVVGDELLPRVRAARREAFE